MKQEEIIRYQFDGLTTEVLEWECLTPTVFLKESVRDEMAKKEIILAYLKASKMLFEGLNADNNPNCFMKVIRKNQVCMPFLYVCRHALELSIKLRIQFETKKMFQGIDFWNCIIN